MFYCILIFLMPNIKVAISGTPLHSALSFTKKSVHARINIFLFYVYVFFLFLFSPPRQLVGWIYSCVYQQGYKTFFNMSIESTDLSMSRTSTEYVEHERLSIVMWLRIFFMQKSSCECECCYLRSEIFLGFFHRCCNYVMKV